MKTLATLLFAALCAAAAVVSYPLWRAPLVQAVPQAAQYLPTLAAAPTGGLTAPAVVTALPPVTTVWSGADCAWAHAILTQDAALDAQAVTTQGPQWAAYYQSWETRWATLLDDVDAVCAVPARPLSGEACSLPPQWFAEAIANHQRDTVAVPTDASWNALWIGHYQRLDGLWATACGSA